MKSSMTNEIDAAFEEGKTNGRVIFCKQGMTDAQFEYLLTKETKKVAEIYIGTC